MHVPCLYPTAECILSCLEECTSTREPSGNCPDCRQKFTRSELTFLGDAADATKKTSHEEADQKPKARESEESDVNGFHLCTRDTLVSANGAGDRRSAFNYFNEDDKRMQRSILHTLPSEFLQHWQMGFNCIGTKVARLLEEIKSMIVNDSTSKAVVFTQYLGNLDLISEELARRGIKFARVDAMMKQHQRADNIQSFTEDPSTKILLLSMKAGAAGLNLVVANFCFILDPALNSGK